MIAIFRIIRARLRVAAAAKRADDNNDACWRTYRDAVGIRNGLIVNHRAAADRLEEAETAAEAYAIAAMQASQRAGQAVGDASRDTVLDEDRFRYVRGKAGYYRTACRIPDDGLGRSEIRWRRAARRTEEILAEIRRYRDQIRLCVDYAEGRRDDLPVDREEYARLKAEQEAAEARRAEWEAMLAARRRT